ncbi:unnamed protein product [Rotaria magnacalcarata]|uniref:Uncharacterized protein n=1 Tax=Rotaria magnacalcarata TaxID=392030 RepID=A0A816W686_9BILA|nr:unnamed protein product [Rotaria magnacalcarata]
MRFQFIVLFVSIFFATVGYSNSIQKRTDVLDNDRMNATMMTVVLQRLKYVDNYNDDMKFALSNSMKEKIIHELRLLEEYEDLNSNKQKDRNYSEPIILSNFINDNYPNIRKANR